MNSDHNTTKKMEGRLRLRRNNDKSQLKQLESLKERTNEKENEKDDEIAIDDKSLTISKRNCCKRAASPDADDSLADFKLPKLITKPHAFNNKVKLVNDKSSTSSSSYGGKKGQLKRRTSTKASEKNQPSIESSFFKPQTAFVCPLCLKSFNDFNAQSIHSKNCASKNNVSTKKLLAAVELQERQAEERLAIGLPAAPFQQAKKKSFNTKKMSAGGDPDIQLAIALSKSLSEIEEKEQFDEALILAAERNENILQMTSSQRKSTLQSFGFVTNKPISEVISEKPRRRKNIGTTILQTRTQETRERLLSEKIGEILIGTESITQLQLSEEKYIDKSIPVLLHSEILKKIHKSDNNLWNQSLRSEQRSAYYVENLSEFISPIDESETQMNNSKNDEAIIVEQPKNEEIVNNLNDVEEGFEEIKLEPVKNPSEETTEINNENNSLISSWRKMINSNAFSDVIINVKNSKYIYCHEIVLWTRCQSIQKDLVVNDDNSHNTQQKKLQWLDINFSSAIAFLGFIYCGEIDLETLENDEKLLEEVLQLAERYKVNEFLKDLKTELTKGVETSEIEIIHENEATNLPTGVEIHQCDEEANPLGDLQCSINTKEKTAEMLNVESKLVDDKEENCITEIKNRDSNGGINSFNNPEWSWNRDELNVQILEEEDESINDNCEEKSERDMNKENNLEINSSGNINSTKPPVESIKKVNEKTPDDLLNKSPNVSCQLHYSRINTSPDMFEDMEMSYNALVSTEINSDIHKMHENHNTESLDVSANVNDNLSSETSEKDENDDYFDTELTETPKRSTRLSSTCPDNSTISKMMDMNKKNDNLRLTSTQKKTKSNISLFIEKIQRNNAKDMLDSDSDDEFTVPEIKKFRRNPFKIRKSHEDSLFITEYKCQGEKNVEKSLSNSFEEINKKKSALSLFEDEIRARLAENSHPVLSQGKLDDSIDVESTNNKDEEESVIQSNESSDDETDGENVSMYTKYKRTHRHNSIGNYRSILKSFIQKHNETDDIKINSEESDEENERIQTNSDDSDNEDIKNIKKNTTNRHEISEINKIRLAELSAFDVYEAMSPSPLNSSLDDSSKTKNSTFEKSLIDLTGSDKESDDNSDELSANKSTNDNKTIEDVNKTSNDKSDKLNSFEYANDDELEFGNWTEEMSEVNNWQPLTQANLHHKSPDKNSPLNQNKPNSLSQLSLNEMESIDLTQSDDDNSLSAKENSGRYQLCDTITENVTRILKDHGVLDSTVLDRRSQRIINNSVPIVLSSDSDAESVVRDTNTSNNVNVDVGNDDFDEFPIENDLENNLMGFVMEGGAETPHSTPNFNDFYLPSTSRLCFDDRNVTIRSNQSIKPINNSIRRNIDIISNNSDESLKIMRNISSPKQSRRSSLSPRKKNSSTRSLTTKSKSESNLTPKGKRLIESRNELITPTKELLSYLNLSSDNCRISFDISPRDNYDAMSSPELNKRLAEYGLRNQKRHRAVKLLNYIYDQLHPMVPEYLLSSYCKNDLSLIIDRDVELKNDELNGEQSESDDEESESSSISNSSAIIDEMMNLSDEYEEYDEKAVILVRDSFQKLINNDRILYNKILKYESIPLETIHEKLKEKGIKSGPQILADYLDDECISFYIENPKKRQRQNKPTRKKNKS